MRSPITQGSVVLAHDFHDFSVFALQIARCIFCEEIAGQNTHLPPFCHSNNVIRFSWVYSERHLIKRNTTEEKSIAMTLGERILSFTSVQ